MVLVGVLGYWRFEHVRYVKRRQAIVALEEFQMSWAHPNPGRLVKAVNLLQTLGKSEAIRCLRELEPRYGGSVYEPVFVLLFDLEPKFGDLYVEKDFPVYFPIRGFHLVTFDDFPVEWAAKHGVLRKTQLRPTDDIAAAMQAIVDQWRQAGTDSGLHRSEWEMKATIAGFLELLPVHPNDWSADSWSDFKERVVAKPVYWDVEAQQYFER
jgi:hypothetical protein